MNNIRRSLDSLIFTMLILGVMWMMPPLIQEIWHKCPSRPDGINEVHAIPAFARKYGFSCEVCHVPSFPKLNDFGNKFRDQGYQLGIDQDNPSNSGTPINYIPLSMRTTVGYQDANLKDETAKINTGSFGFSGLDILGFGLLTKDINYGVVYTPGLANAGFETSSTADESDLESAFVRLNNLQRFLGITNHDYLINMEVGKFELDLPFSEHRNPTLNTPFVIYHYQPGVPYSNILSGIQTNSYPSPDDFFLGDNQPGLQLLGFMPTAGEGIFHYALSALSNSNVNMSGSGGGHGTNFYGHVSQSLGGYGVVTGQRIGIFGTFGMIPSTPSASCPDCFGVGDKGEPYSRVGADVSVTINRHWNIFGAWIHAKDSRALFSEQGISSAQEAVWNGGFIQVDWAPLVLPLFKIPNCLLSYRYDVIRNHRQGDSAFPPDFNDVDSHTILARYHFYSSNSGAAAFHLEYNWYKDQGVGSNGDDLIGNAFLTGLDLAY